MFSNLNDYKIFIKNINFDFKKLTNNINIASMVSSKEL